MSALIPVAITQRVDTHPERGERRDALDQRWGPFLAACGLLAVPVPNHPGQALALVQAVGACGVVLSGGGDVPGLGGGAGESPPERDATEAALLAWARAEGLPVLGVCRGMQVLQTLFGVPLEPVEGHVARRHRLHLVEGGGGGAQEVNSYHRFAARRSGGGLLTVATAEGGCVEWVRHEAEPLHGIMWHPERESPPDAADIALLRAIFLGEGRV